MARLLGPQCRNCRREGIKLMLKGIRCETAKCPMEKENRNNPPGMHMWRRGKTSEYGVRLREKQKVKRYYGVLEKQFRRVMDQERLVDDLSSRDRPAEGAGPPRWRPPTASSEQDH